jgi:death-on-curing protein
MLFESWQNKVRLHWLSQNVILAVHDEQIAEHGGSLGVRDMGLLASALARPQHLCSYSSPTIVELAAAYAVGIIQNHPFVDGNKRTGFLAAYIFLALNGLRLTASETEVVRGVLGLAQGEIDEKEFCIWLGNNITEK